MTTLGQILTEIQMDFNFTTTLPPTTSEEYLRFVGLVNRYEKQWARTKNYQWSGLFKSTTLSTTANVATVSLPSGFNGLIATTDGSIKINSNYYKLVRFDEVAGLPTNTPIMWITGDPVKGYTLNLQPTPTDIKTISLNYFTSNLAYASDMTTEKEIMTTSTDYTKCPDPLWISDMVLYNLNKTEAENATNAADYLNSARERMNTMLGYENAINFNQSQEIPVMADDEGYPTVGN